ncbi:MAG TPA: glycosyltransferase [Xanthobacteraceae bacterium]|nr:glycosyltransferase [Xanthobacteraceae bacterium]
MSRRLRILLYVQHLTGVGPYVRTSEIAKALAQRHDVMLTDGGQPVPRTGMERVAMLPLPRVRRQGSRLAAFHGESEIAAVMQARHQCLRETIRSFRPDVLLVEHYPFSKWVLGDEIASMVAESRAANSAVKIICSVRDIQPRSRHEACSDEDYAREVTSRLRAHFDGIIVHGDPLFARLETELPFLAAAGLCLAYTGIVSERPAATNPDWIKAAVQPSFILASVGGGSDRADLLRHVLKAWQRLKETSGFAEWKLLLCHGLGEFDSDLVDQVRRHGEAVVLRPFGTDFLPLLQVAALSVSCAGYNTCANILETRCRAVLVPDPEMSDQSSRASLLAARQVAVVVPPAGLTAAKLAAAILKCLAPPPPKHDIALDGAERTRVLIEEMAGSRPQAVNFSA